MAELYLKWDNALATINNIARRASKRIKTVGGTWITTGFTPANDFSPTIFQVRATVNPNKVYEFKVENICITGGPTINDNGVQENIKFECIIPDLGADTSSISVNINLASTDITKVRLVLKQQSDNLIVGGPIIVNNVADAATYTFTGLTVNTGYYVTVELYATVNGVDVISSDVAYIGSVCGGNTSGYQISTDSTCTTVNLQSVSGSAAIEYINCSGTLVHIPVTVSPIDICTDGSGITTVLGAITINSTTPGSC